MVQTHALSASLEDQIGSALEETHRMSRIVESLLTISRLDAGEANLDRARLDLGDLTNSTAHEMNVLAQEKALSLRSSAVGTVYIEGDRTRLQQVVANLIDNAIKYTQEGGTVEVKVQREAGKAILEVSDNGVGIPTTAIPHVFERFYRVDKARSRASGGAGLGLSIVKAICTAHGGEISVCSEEGRGSRFRVELPLVALSDYPEPAVSLRKVSL
jgi:signal transduction histidine kinase